MFEDKKFPISHMVSQVGNGETRKSAVAEALGTKFELPVNKPLSHSKSSGQVRNPITAITVYSLGHAL